MMVKEKALKKAVSDSLRFLEIASGKKRQPDYQVYRRDKRKLENMALTAEEHERAAKIAARCRGI